MDPKELWQDVLGEIELTISKANYITWFQNTKIQNKKDGLVTISAPNGFTKEWLENKYNKLILKLLRDKSSDVKEIQFIIGQGQLPSISHTSLKKPVISTATDQLNFPELEQDRETNLNPKYNFDNFVIGSFNELAQAAGRAIVKNPGTLYNPLFIYGGVGLGKTHLLQAIGNALGENKEKNKKVKYISSDKFTSELVDALSKKGMDGFKKKYHKIDALIIDDIQFIAGKEKTQEEFFHIFNTLHQNNKQIIIASDKPPAAIATLEDRLRSRFEGGMIADISFPDLETRTAILKNKAIEKKFEISDEVINYLATHIQKNIRELEGALNRVIAYSELNHAVPTIKSTEKILGQIINAPKKMTNCKNILKIVSEFYDISTKELIDRSRKKELVRPRQITMYLIREELRGSYPFIGDKLGGRDHTTVMYACQKISKEIQANDTLQYEINLIKERLYN